MIITKVTSIRNGLLLMMFFVSFSACAQHSINSSTTTSTTSDVNDAAVDLKGMPQDILYLINEYRTSKGMPALQMAKEAATEAIQHSVDMADQSTSFGHDGFANRINNISKQLGFIRESGENVAYGRLSAKQVVDLWLNSSPHKKNIEGNFTLTGIGVAKSTDGTIYYTQIFLRK